MSEIESLRGQIQYWQLATAVVGAWSFLATVFIFYLMLHHRGHAVDIPSGMTLDTTQTVWVDGRMFFSQQEYEDSMRRVRDSEQAKKLYMAQLEVDKLLEPR